MCLDSHADNFLEFKLDFIAVIDKFVSQEEAEIDTVEPLQNVDGSVPRQGALLRIVHESVRLISIDVEVLDDLLILVMNVGSAEVICFRLVASFDIWRHVGLLGNLEASELHHLKHADAADRVRLIDPSLVHERHFIPPGVHPNRPRLAIPTRSGGASLKVIVLNDVADGRW